MSTIAVIGAGTIGETLISGLLRSGWSADRLIATERRPERGEELAGRYGIRIVENEEAVLQADVRPTRMRCVTLPITVLKQALTT